MSMVSLTGPRHVGMFCLCSHPLLPQKVFFNFFTIIIMFIETSVMLQCNSNYLACKNILLTNVMCLKKGDLARIIG